MFKMSEQKYNSSMLKYWLVDAVANLGKYGGLIFGLSGIIREEVSPERIAVGALIYLGASGLDYVARGRVQELQRSKLEEKFGLEKKLEE